jgi:hypothetical protein
MGGVCSAGGSHERPTTGLNLDEVSGAQASERLSYYWSANTEIYGQLSL